MAEMVDPKRARIIVDFVRAAAVEKIPVRVFADEEHRRQALEDEEFGRTVREYMFKNMSVEHLPV